ncbi:MAG: hypothetical protein PWR10_2152 [Halanaerobiales bacterium]|nr:hypothetical protein [Halanaerobiales bacterium]
MLALEKIIASFISPPGLFILLWLIITIYLMARARSFLIKFLAFFTLLLMFLTFSGLGIKIFLIRLEDTYQDQTGSFTRSYPIVILGGGINYGFGRGEAELNSITLQRLVKGYRLFNKLGGSIIFTGGIGVGQQEISEAEIAAEWLREMGVPEDKIVRESRARSTYENGLYVKEWLDNHNYHGRVYLVTSAVHLPRAMMVFYKQGIKAIPVPAGYLSSHRLSWLDYLPNRAALNANLAAIHEWAGILWYKFRGRI